MILYFLIDKLGNTLLLLLIISQMFESTTIHIVYTNYHKLVNVIHILVFDAQLGIHKLIA